jgi:diguanylate cyclase (GGDEF)-like protein/PAS domain S-box-containing protein
VRNYALTMHLGPRDQCHTSEIYGLRLCGFDALQRRLPKPERPILTRIVLKMPAATNRQQELIAAVASVVLVTCASLFIFHGVGEIDIFTRAALTAAIILAAVVVATMLDRLSGRQSRFKVRADLATQQRLRGIIQETGMGFWETEVSSDEVFISDTYARMLGMKRDANVPLSMEEWFALIHVDDQQRVAAAIQEVGDTYEGSALYRLEYRVRHTFGYHIWVLSLGAVAERHPDGTPFLIVGTLSDITEQKQVQLALTASEQSFRSLFEQVPIGIALTDYRSREFLNVNNALLDSTGYSRDDLLSGMRYDQLARTPDGSTLNQPVGQRERDFTRKDGTSFPVLVSGTKMQTAEGREVVWSIIHDISERKAAERELTFAANCDRLTGLANRAQFIERLTEAISRVKKGRQKLFAVLFIDFDRFKTVNDAMGHQAGDQLLVQIGSRLRKGMRVSDFRPGSNQQNQVARFGGDEFLILLNDVGNEQDAMVVAERLQQVLARPYFIQGREVQSTASIGIVTSEMAIESADAIIRNADVAMYEAKREGRACSVLFSQTMLDRRSRYVMLEYGLRHALQNSEFTLEYQSIIELETGKRSSVEALLRWKHPKLGLISPAEFVPIAEESGLIVPIGAWVLRESLGALARLRAQDPVDAPQCVSVNLSRAELAQGHRLIERVRAALEEVRLPAQCLQLEVTEREVMRDPESSLQLMQDLRDMGVRLAMDDFGTGTSSLSCLADYPFDVIKIDRSFIHRMSELPETQVVVRAAIALVENLGRRSVAEGVETPEQLAVLQLLGCHYAQGYFLGMPVPEARVMPGPAVTDQFEARQRKQG